MTTPLRKVRVGLVGAGYVSEYHIRALQALPEVAITGITDLDQSRARAVATRFKLDSYSSLETMAVQGLDVVHVMTPPASHVAVAVKGAEFGMPCTCREAARYECRGLRPFGS